MSSASGDADRQRFYRERDRRTVEYGLDGTKWFEMPVTVVVGDDAATSFAGQVCALALVNMLARLHRRLTLHVSPAPLIAVPLAGGADLAEACLATAYAIDPYCLIDSSVPEGRDGPSIGLGSTVPSNLSWYLSANRFAASLSKSPEPFSSAPSTPWGASLAACLGAAAVLRAVLGNSVLPCRVSLWDFSEGGGVSLGPEAVGRVDVGDVALIGAGAVGIALAYWLRQLGLGGRWSVIDGDRCALHNMNRSIGMLIAHTEWAGREPKPKADVAAALIGGEPFPVMYEAWIAAHPEARPDLVLPLANGPGLRARIGQRGESILLHSTTSRAWTAELHRHIPGRDDCIACRFPETPHLEFPCSEAPLDTSRSHLGNDAALPFLSASAGLLLSAALLQLQLGRIAQLAPNQWRLHLEVGHRVVQRSIHSCPSGCPNVVELAAREVINRGKRWSAVA